MGIPTNHKHLALVFGFHNLQNCVRSLSWDGEMQIWHNVLQHTPYLSLSGTAWRQTLHGKLVHTIIARPKRASQCIKVDG
jgi:hypothetical protein|mmetsp:Transcript_25349/g.40160  ORF Transcript_25349/g.40160 Transcript_25349/m.40160 type:complete len:80 (-) Transcript_25349:506-745(-)